MNQIESSIQYVDRLFNEFSWKPETLEKLKQQRDFIAAKYADKRLYLAVIGDFSSGKSTLINALCGYDCLKTGIMATTAVPTYIQNMPLPQPELLAELRDGRGYRLTDVQDIRDFCEACGVTLGSDFKENLEKVTTLEAVAQRAGRISVLLPDNGVLGSLCIIDTPGVNPGQENSELHVTRTKQVLEQTADSVIVLFPATQAYTLSFERFLKENADRFLEDAVFLLTMIDRVDEEEREELEQYVRDSIRQKMHIQNPLLVSCSAYLAGRDEGWKRRFDDLRETLLTHLRERKEYILGSRMAGLLSQILQSMKEDVAQQTQTLRDSLTVLEENTPPHLNRTLDTIRDKESGRLGAIKSAFLQYEERMRKEMMEDMTKIIELRVSSFKAHSDFSSYTDRPDGLAADLANQTQKYYGYSDQISETLRELVNWTSDHMLKALEGYYGRLTGAVLLRNVEVAAISHPVYEKIGESLSQVRQSYAKVDTKKAVLTSGSAAAIGLIILGPIGLVVGGIAGYLGKDKLFLGKARTDFVLQVKQQLPAIVANISSECIDRTIQYVDQCINRMDGMARYYLSAYAQVYQDALKAYENLKTELSRRIADNERCTSDIEEQIQNLKQIPVRSETIC